MNYLYHRVPEQMQGTVLLPLNAFAERWPELYRAQTAKYRGRENLMKARVLSLDCFWNDVIHMTAVHPGEIKSGLAKVGHPTEELGSFFEIDPLQLDVRLMAVYKHIKPAHDTIPPGEILHFQRQHLQKYAQIPDAARAYWERCKRARQQPMAFGFIPHILHRGPIDVSSSPVINP